MIIAISTTGQGEFPQNARSLWKILLSRQLRPGLLRRVNFTTFGLGDSSYPRYNVAHRMLHGRLLQLGAQLFCQRGEGNEQHPEGYNGDFRNWIVDLRESLLQHFPLPDDQQEVAHDVFLEPKWMLRLAEESQPVGETVADSAVNAVLDFAKSAANGIKEALTAESPPGDDLLPVKGSITADLVANKRLTPTDHYQDVRVLDFSLSEKASYGPGAVAVIYPKNFPQDVNQFIETMEWQDMADKPLDLIPTRSTTDVKQYPPSPLRNFELAAGTLTLRTLLTNYLDILSIPRRSFFANLAYFAKDSNEDEQYQKERILELANPELIDELWDYTTRPRRTILEIMPDFPSIKIPWQYALSTIPIMRGRQFSIASGGSIKHSPSGNTKVELLVAIANPPNPIIKYRKRHGVCTRYIASLKAGQKLNISIQPGYLNIKPEEAETPVVMIGPGTGVAPMRSMIYERLAWARQNPDPVAERKPLEGSVLFFGCRNRDADFFFSDEWTMLAHEGLKVFAGFSRDKDTPKTYVQDLIREQKDLVFDVLVEKKGKVYVCGSSGNMPKGVRAALVDVLRERGGLDEEEAAEGYLDGLEKEGRYKQETW